MSAPAWQLNTAQWMAAAGVHDPWIAEISPMQLGLMSRRQREAYARKRKGEWDAADACKGAWRTAVLAAFDAGEFEIGDPRLTNDAGAAVRCEQTRRAEAAAEAAKTAARDADVIRTAGELAVGDRVWSVVTRQYSVVTKVNKVSVVLDGDWKVYPAHGSLARRSPADRDAATALEAAS